MGNLRTSAGASSSFLQAGRAGIMLSEFHQKFDCHVAHDNQTCTVDQVLVLASLYVHVH